jgi:hypothetical protein
VLLKPWGRDPREFEQQTLQQSSSLLATCKSPSLQQNHHSNEAGYFVSSMSLATLSLSPNTSSGVATCQTNQDQVDFSTKSLRFSSSGRTHQALSKSSQGNGGVPDRILRLEVFDTADGGWSGETGLAIWDRPGDTEGVAVTQFDWSLKLQLLLFFFFLFHMRSDQI